MKFKKREVERPEAPKGFYFVANPDHPDAVEFVQWLNGTGRQPANVSERRWALPSSMFLGFTLGTLAASIVLGYPLSAILFRVCLFLLAAVLWRYTHKGKHPHDLRLEYLRACKIYLVPNALRTRWEQICAGLGYHHPDPHLWDEAVRRYPGGVASATFSHIRLEGSLLEPAAIREANENITQKLTMIAQLMHGGPAILERPQDI